LLKIQISRRTFKKCILGYKIYLLVMVSDNYDLLKMKIMSSLVYHYLYYFTI